MHNRCVQACIRVGGVILFCCSGGAINRPVPEPPGARAGSGMWQHCSQHNNSVNSATAPLTADTHPSFRHSFMHPEAPSGRLLGACSTERARGCGSRERTRTSSATCATRASASLSSRRTAPRRVGERRNRGDAPRGTHASYHIISYSYALLRVLLTPIQQSQPPPLPPPAAGKRRRRARELAGRGSSDGPGRCVCVCVCVCVCEREREREREREKVPGARCVSEQRSYGLEQHAVREVSMYE